jgi:hypothetical protein
MFCKRGEVLLFMGIWIGGVLATIDLTLPELEHVAHNLRKRDCKKLVAALNGPRSDIINNADVAERRMPRSISCLRQLKHWNSQLGEEKEESYARLTQGLKELGHDNLAEWLTRNMIHHRVENLKRTLLVNPSVDVTQANETQADETLKRVPKFEKPEDIRKWQPLDIVLCGFLVIFLPLILCCLTNVAFCKKRRFERNVEDNKPSVWKPAQWKLRRSNESETEESLLRRDRTAPAMVLISSDSEDETVFPMSGTN